MREGKNTQGSRVRIQRRKHLRPSAFFIVMDRHPPFGYGCCTTKLEHTSPSTSIEYHYRELCERASNNAWAVCGCLCGHDPRCRRTTAGEFIGRNEGYGWGSYLSDCSSRRLKDNSVVLTTKRRTIPKPHMQKIHKPYTPRAQEEPTLSAWQDTNAPKKSGLEIWSVPPQTRWAA